MTYLRDSDREALRLAHDLREEMRVWLASRGTNAPLSVSPFVDPGGQPSVLVTMSADVARALAAMLAELRGQAAGRPGPAAGVPHHQTGDTGGFPALGDSGGFRTVTDTGDFRPVHETGGLPAVHETGGFPRVHDTGGLRSVGHGVPQAQAQAHAQTHAPTQALTGPQPVAGLPHQVNGAVNAALHGGGGGVAGGAPTSAGLPHAVNGTGGFPPVPDTGYRTPAVPAGYQQTGQPRHR